MIDDKAAAPAGAATGSAPKRRGLLIGAAAAGAATLAVKTIPGVAPTPGASVAAQAVPDRAAGYQLTPHVLRYYETARA